MTLTLDLYPHFSWAFIKALQKRKKMIYSGSECAIYPLPCPVSLRWEMSCCRKSAWVGPFSLVRSCSEWIPYIHNPVLEGFLKLMEGLREVFRGTLLPGLSWEGWVSTSILDKLLTSSNNFDHVFLCFSVFFIWLAWTKNRDLFGEGEALQSWAWEMGLNPEKFSSTRAQPELS